MKEIPTGDNSKKTIRQQQRDGEWYEAIADEELVRELHQCQQLCFDFNQMAPSRQEERMELVKRIFGKTGSHLNVHAPLHCDFGYNIEVGDYFFANFNLTILDENLVTFGDHVFVGPNCSFYTPLHPLDIEKRNQDIQSALPIHIGDNVWFGGNVIVLPGVSIGSGTTIGAGSVVTHDIPGNVLAAGNPCNVIRPL
ncbi:maltose acetyltransferase [Hallella multisaccharivorax DSM 17128]|uniref:Acetyltransferase n=1 Tax=Hallella multisaccharivorax DSM 17128 TaxID=688246 RepID=F8NC21_9BACT|nr:sugar O-acetyltransferase [Hallella multisaccharivorax]EGN56988.1 Galactoside O-acetyltransferase [Hallella multisaccharivorax DSM 17128]GJG30530.1 maltose acetyltransferase [Hallella multisaccharivorax DSM 17128]